MDYQGRVLAASDYFTSDQQTMVAYVPTEGVPTIYATIGDTFAWLCCAGLAALALIGVGRGRRFARGTGAGQGAPARALAKTGSSGVESSPGRNAVKN